MNSWITGAVLFVCTSTAWANPSLPREGRAQSPASAGPWQFAIDELRVAKDVSVQRLLKGHLSLAANRSNAALDLFASCLDGESLAHWNEWTAHVTREHPSTSMAWYLHGDARARERDWDSALEALERAIELDGENHLALNALGVVQHAKGDTLRARSSFAKACKASSVFADAYASRGTLNVFLGSTKGRESFEKARRFSRDEQPVLALVGLSCVAFGEGEREEAIRLLRHADARGQGLPLARENLVALDLAALSSAANATERVGSSIRVLKLDSSSDGASGASGAGDTVIWVVVKEDGTIVIHVLDSDGRERRHEIPPPGRSPRLSSSDNDGDDATDWPGIIELAYERLEQLREQLAACRARGGDCSELERQIRELEEAIAGIGERTQRDDQRATPERLFPRDLRSTLGADRSAADAEALRRISAEISQVATRLTTELRGQRGGAAARTVEAGNRKKVGGADSDSSRTWTNRGSWPVRTVYGLLYDISNGPAARR